MVGNPTLLPLITNSASLMAPLSVGAIPNQPGRSSLQPQSSIREPEDRNEIQTSIFEPTDMAVERLLQETSHRGKGSHHCPYGIACVKGGVSTDDKLVLFERNSAFRYVTTAWRRQQLISEKKGFRAHLEKHLKLYKCHLPGCSNKTGFSRLDLLHRHQTGVPHNPPDGTMDSE